MAIKLGSIVRDSVTDYEGVAVSRTEYLNGCIRIAIQGKAKDNEVKDPLWVDEEQVLVVSEKIDEAPRASTTGGDRPAPRGRHDAPAR